MSKKTINTVTILSGIVVILVGVAIWLSATGYLVITWNSTPQTKMSSISQDKANNSGVCGDSTVNAYNKIYSYKMQDGFDIYTVDNEGLKKLITDIKSVAGYENDPTCQTIFFWAAVNDKDHKTAQDAYNAINKLHDEHHFADSNLRNSQQLLTYKSILDGLLPSNQNGDGLGTNS